MYVGTDARLGRRTVVLAAAAALLGLALVALLALLGAGAAVSGWLRADLGSPVLAAVLVACVPLIGLGVGWLIEQPFRPEDDLVPHWALRGRSAIWTGATLVAIAFALLRLLS